MKLASKKLASNPMFSLIRILRFYEMYDIVVKFWLVVCVRVSICTVIYNANSES